MLVPLLAHSAATLICLGADQVVMSKTGELSPIDPTVANAFNPRDEFSKQPLGISVEDVTSFIALAQDKDRVGISGEDNVTKVFQTLAERIHPLALGNVNRSHKQIRLLAQKLLELGIGSGEPAINVDEVINALTERLYTHGHSIYREEARKAIGLGKLIADATEHEEALLWDLYLEYESELQLKTVFDPNVHLGAEDEALLETTAALTESTALSSAFNYRQRLRRAVVPDMALRAQLALQNAQHALNVATLRSQLVQLRVQHQQQRLNVAGMMLQSGANPALTQLQQAMQDADNQIAALINAEPPTIDTRALRLHIETDILSIGWTTN